MLLVGAVTLGGVIYVKTHPLVFNESFWCHAHCMPQFSSALLEYARKHQGAYPAHTNGYGDALLQLMADPRDAFLVTGPGYELAVFEKAFITREDVDERQCGRVYVQGLSETNNPNIAIVFNKVAAPPDHCHFLKRFTAGYVREVCLVDGSWRMVRVEEWPAFAQEQVKLLVAAGFSEAHAQALYDQAK